MIMLLKDMPTNASLIPTKRIERAILMIRSQKVLLDADLAALFGVSTKRLNEQVKRNQVRFPADFMFELTAEEKNQVVANCDHLKRLKYSPTLPHAFTEYGALMAANVLNSPAAIQASIQIVRTFVRLRQVLASNVELARRLAALERKYDKRFAVVFDAIRRLMIPPTADEKKREIGFQDH